MLDNFHTHSASIVSQLLGKIDPTPIIGSHAVHFDCCVLRFSVAIISVVCFNQSATSLFCLKFFDKIKSTVHTYKPYFAFEKLAIRTPSSIGAIQRKKLS